MKKKSEMSTARAAKAATSCDCHRPNARRRAAAGVGGFSADRGATGVGVWGLPSASARHAGRRRGSGDIAWEANAAEVPTEGRRRARCGREKPFKL